MIYRKLIKRLLDIIGVLIILTLLWPIIVGIGLFLAFYNGGKVFFLQQRPGINCKPFLLYKFRTMRDPVDKHGNIIPESQRITAFGSFLRRTALDELPQLLNVLKGDMSIIGPRPLLMAYLPLYTERQLKRHTVLPGITGWSQVQGRNETPWELRLERDVFYAENISITLDAKIIWLTFKHFCKLTSDTTISPIFEGTHA